MGLMTRCNPTWPTRKTTLLLIDLLLSVDVLLVNVTLELFLELNRDFMLLNAAEGALRANNEGPKSARCVQPCGPTCIFEGSLL
jgi:hypothetical protein